MTLYDDCAEYAEEHPDALVTLVVLPDDAGQALGLYAHAWVDAADAMVDPTGAELEFAAVASATIAVEHGRAKLQELLRGDS